ncbi:LysR family transcriptional regulator, partial [Leisingera sp.]|uniref:LysR family transcriptional regulator n=1 Tax=Leisingera sp. TaxID=1879318 RepID=UPI002B26EE7B
MNIPLTFRQVEILLAVADTGSTAGASRALNTSQPSVSLAIARCEEVFGQKLFVRIPGRGMELTPFGQHKIAQLHELEKQARWVLSGGEGTPEFLNLGVFSTLGPRYAPQLVRRFMETRPDAEIRILEGDLQTLFDWLSEGRIDLALLYVFGVPSDFAITPLMAAEPYALLPEGHRLAGQPRVSAEDLAQEPIILMNLPHSRGYFLSLLQNARTPVRVAHETGSIEMLRSMVANGFGAGLLATDLPDGMCYDGNRVVRVPLSGHPPLHQIALAHRGAALK